MRPTQYVKDVFSRSRCAVLTTLSVAVLGYLGVAVATTAGAAAPALAQHDITVLLGSEFLHKIDQEPAGSQPHDLSAGDTLLHYDPVLDPDSGVKIGTAVTRVQAVRPLGEGDVLFILDCTVRLPDGNLVFYGPEQLSHVPTGTTYSLVGGTDGYAGAQGVVKGVVDKRDGKDVLSLEFKFSRP